MECHKVQFLGKLVLLHGNNLLKIQKTETVFYADDTNIMVTNIKKF
jgi:hypothetical protein